MLPKYTSRDIICKLDSLRVPRRGSELGADDTAQQCASKAVSVSRRQSSDCFFIYQTRTLRTTLTKISGINARATDLPFAAPLAPPLHLDPRASSFINRLLDSFQPEMSVIASRNRRCAAAAAATRQSHG